MRRRLLSRLPVDTRAWFLSLGMAGVAYLAATCVAAASADAVGVTVAGVVKTGVTMAGLAVADEAVADKAVADKAVADEAKSAAEGTAGIASNDRQNEAVASLHEYLASFDSIKADFQQEGQEVSSSGSFWLAGKSFRIETGPPISQWLVSDGKNLWSWDLDLEQVIITSSDQHEDIPLLLLAGDKHRINRLYHVSKDQYESSLVYTLTPKTEEASQLARELTLVITDGKPAAFSLRAVTGQSAWIELSSVELDPEIPAETFVLDIPKDVDLIDDRLDP